MLTFEEELEVLTLRRKMRFALTRRVVMAKRHYGSHPEYERRMKEMTGDGMISDDRSQIANLPQNEMVKLYSKNGSMPEVMDDTIRGIDRQIGGDESKRKSHFKPHKY